MGALVFMIVWLPLIMIAPIYAEWKVKKDEKIALNDVKVSNRARY